MATRNPLLEMFTLEPAQFDKLREQLPITDRAFAALRLALTIEAAARNPEHVELEVSGEAPLTFEGRLLAECSGGWHLGKQLASFFDLRVWVTSAGTYVLQRHYCTTWKGESPQSRVMTSSDLSRIVDFLRSWSPRELHHIGFPDPTHPQFEKKQEKYLSSLEAHYQHRVSKLLESLPVAKQIP